MTKASAKINYQTCSTRSPAQWLSGIVSGWSRNWARLANGWDRLWRQSLRLDHLGSFIQRAGFAHRNAAWAGLIVGLAAAGEGEGEGEGEGD